LNFSRSGRIYEAVVAAFNARMILVAWNQYERADIAVGNRSNGGNLSGVIDINPIHQLQTKVGGYKSV
jgi:hypothetical protein